MNQPDCGDGWRVLKPPLPMPAPESSDSARVNGTELHYGFYGEAGNEPIILLHGGLGASEDFGGQIAALAAAYRVIAIDSRGHGRSRDDGQPYSYRQLAGDVIDVMDRLDIGKAAIVGWSDGGIIGIDLALSNPERLTRVVAIGANFNKSALRPTVFNDALIHAYVGHATEQYARISPTPDRWEEFSAKVFALWGSQPNYTEAEIAAISTPFLIAAGVYEEAIDETHTRRMVELMPNAQLCLFENASHFAPWQQPTEVNKAILGFLGSA